MNYGITLRDVFLPDKCNYEDTNTRIFIPSVKTKNGHERQQSRIRKVPNM